MSWCAEQSPDRPERTLVIGHGFIGGAVAGRLLTAGVPTVALTRSEIDRPAAPGLEMHVGNCADQGLLSKLAGDVDAVIYCAGGLMPATSESRVTDDLDLALAPLIGLLDVLAENPAPPRLVYLSSGGTVYGEPRYLPVDEDHPTDPINSYGILKLAAEKFCLRYARLTGVTVTVLRCSNVYGSGQRTGRGQGAVGEFLHRIRTDQPITVYGDGLAERDYIHVDDVADAVVSAALELRDGLRRTLNLSVGKGTSVRELVEILEKALGKSAALTFHRPRASDGKSVVLCNRRIRDLLPFQPRSITEGIAQLVDSAAPEAVGLSSGHPWAR